MGECDGGHSLLADRLCDPGWAFAALRDFENQPTDENRVPGLNSARLCMHQPVGKRD